MHDATHDDMSGPTAARVRALLGELAALLAQGGAPSNLIELARTASERGIDQLWIVGDVAERLAARDLTRASVETQRQVQALLRAVSVSRLIRLHDEMVQRGSGSAERVLQLAEEWAASETG